MDNVTRSPRNTSQDDPAFKLLVGLAPGGVESQERQGQAEMVGSTTLPTDLNRGSREEFEALGFTFGETIPGDPLFQQATLPAGWKREGSDHAMWSYICDERGIQRVAIFYKAAFYDRRAHMDIVNVGHKVASDYIYGDAPSFAPPSELTPDERREAVASAGGYTRNADEYPDIYGDRLPRAWRVIEALGRVR